MLSTKLDSDRSLFNWEHHRQEVYSTTTTKAHKLLGCKITLCSYFVRKVGVEKKENLYPKGLVAGAIIHVRSILRMAIWVAQHGRLVGPAQLVLCMTHRTVCMVHKRKLLVDPARQVSGYRATPYVKYKNWPGPAEKAGA